MINNENIVYISILAILECYYKWFDASKRIACKNDNKNNKNKYEYDFLPLAIKFFKNFGSDKDIQ